MRAWMMTAGAVLVVLVCGAIVRTGFQAPAVLPLDEKVLREYAGVYQWSPQEFVYLQMWAEFPKNQLGAFDESGDIRALYPTERDRFFAGPGLAVATAVESRIDFQRDAAGRITSLTWRRDGNTRTARRVDVEKHEDVSFSNGDVRLAGTLMRPANAARYPAIILVHGSGAATREQILPFARFLIRHGFAILAYDKRGAGASTGDWNVATFDDLAGDVVAAFEYLKTRPEIDGSQVGVLGVSQAGWVMPLAAVRARDIAFLISISGAGVPGSETTIDHAEREMKAGGMKPDVIAQIIAIMKLQTRFARTGDGWDDYRAARERLAARIGTPPDTFPGTPDHPYWGFIRRLYLYDPAPTLAQLRLPVLALFGELDDNILPEKNKNAWQSALKEGGNADYTLQILPNGNHYCLEAKLGTNGEVPSLQRFVPVYFSTIRDWLSKRIRRN